MPSQNYKKGRAKEYRIKKAYEKNGWKVLRTAGSHGFADLIAIHPKEHYIFFIQSKQKNFSKKQKKKLEQEFEWLNSEFTCKFIVV